MTQGNILEISGYYWKTCTLHAGVKLDIFTTLSDQKRSAGDISKELGTDERATSMLLNALCAMQLLKKEGDIYFNTPISQEFLSKHSPKYLGFIIKHHHHLVESWANLHKAVETGKPQRTRSSFNDDDARESFLMGMFNLAMGIAPKLVKEINLSGKKHILDLGGGPGTYAIHFCKENQNLNGTVFDLSTTKPFALKTIEKFGLKERIDFIPGDYVKIESIPGKYDVAWLSHILHGESPQDCQQIVCKAVNALEQGGLIMIHEFILDNSMDSPPFPTLFSLNMLLGTEGGQAYSEQNLTDMLTNAGVINVTRLPFKGPSESGIITGIKK